MRRASLLALVDDVGGVVLVVVEVVVVHDDTEHWMSLPRQKKVTANRFLL